MQAVQTALASTGIPVFANAWHKTAAAPTAPDTYAVYTTLTTEDEHWDDTHIRYKVYVYLNLWTKGDPTENIQRIRSAMRGAGFALSSERDSYEEDTDNTLISWTWVIWQDGDANGPQN